MMRARAKLTVSNRFSTAMLVMVTGCATVSPLVPLDGGGPTSRTILQATNNNSDDVQVLLIKSGTVIRLGSVAGLSTRVFIITDSQLGDGGDLQLVAARRSSPHTQRSHMFAASVGQRITWLINYHLPSDVVMVR